MTPSNGCSKRTSRRSNAPRGTLRGGLRLGRRAGLLAAVLLAQLLAAGAACAQSVDLTVDRRPDALIAGVRFHWDHVDELASSLRDGLESRITFTVRLYERRSVFLFAADRMVAERTVVRSALWDFLGQRFVVESAPGTRRYYPTLEDLLNGFFSLVDFVLPVPGYDRGQRRYVTARAQFEPVALAPPLTLVSLVGAGATSSTPWVRREAP